MAKRVLGWKLGEIAKIIEGTLDGPAEMVIDQLDQAHANNPGALAFCESPAFLAKAMESTIGALLVTPSADVKGRPCIRVEKPRLAFFKLLHMAERKQEVTAGIHLTADIHPSARVSETASVGAYSVIEADCVIADHAVVGPNCFVGPGCELSENVRLYPDVTLVQDVVIGARSVVFSGCVIGADGFGFVWDGSRHVKVPQVGGVRIGMDCEIGANACIDRAMVGDTILGDGCKLDNFVHIAHNNELGNHVVIAAQTGFSGTVTVKDRVTIGGQSGAKEGTVIGSDIQLGGRTGVMQDLTEPGAYFGVPAVPVKEHLRIMLLQQKLPEMMKRIKALEEALAKAEAKP
jgi:UDP-3-O-[3-hydroxymyristoyl] glucosamine N-acyltransferase